MSLQCGIVGLPNVGKSTLFNALTKAGIAAENYPFCTIEPNVGVVELPDPRLKALAERAQVLVVTHSPQVAAKGAHHWQVSKRVEKGATLSTVATLSPEERIEEIARMLAGDTVTDAAREAARALLA